MGQMDERIEALIEQVTETKKLLATERDKLRTAVDELSDLLYIVEGSIESFDDGIRELRTGLDQLSEVV